jgi:Glycosyl hydrolase family 26
MTSIRHLPARIALVIATLLIAVAAGTPVAAEAGTKPASPKTHTPMYWGAWIGSQLTGAEAPWDVGAVAAFERQVGKRASLVNFSSPWQNCSSDPCTFYAFDTVAMNNIRSHGAIPFFSWGSDSLPFQVDQPRFSLAAIIAGTWDPYITSWATDAKDWGHPFFLRLNWEMNGNWFPWSVGVNGNTAAQEVRAWRHIHDIFTSVGAANVTWVWCPNVDPAHHYASLASTYPGDAYVDWTGLDGYNWGAPWKTFDQLFRSTYEELVTRIAPGKPVVVGETASTEHRGSKATWITDLLTTELPRHYPRIKAFVWFDKYDSSMDWPLASSKRARAAFARGIAAGVYAPNRFGSLSGARIRPLA